MKLQADAYFLPRLLRGLVAGLNLHRLPGLGFRV
jgi:hypothetical protein